jgi:hypothetical protein
MRHWRIVPRTVGIRAPVCIYCGSPNPRPLSKDEWITLIDWANHYNVGIRCRTAIEEREAAARNATADPATAAARKITQAKGPR